MKSFKQLMEIVAPDVKTDLKSLDATSFAKKHGKTKSEIKNTFESAEEKTPEPGREAVGGRFTSRPAKSVMKPAPQVTTEAKDPKEYGYEGDMAMNQLRTITRHAEYLMDMMKPDTDLPEWVQSKITLATDYIQTACDYMTSEMNEAANPAQQAAIAINMKKKGIKPKNEEVVAEANDNEAYSHYKKHVLPIYKKHGLSPEFAKAVNNHVAKHGSWQVYNHHGDADGQDPHWFDSEKQKVKPIKQKRGYEVSEDIERIEEMDKSQTPPGRDGGHQFGPGPKVSKKDINAVKKNPAKHLSNLFAKQYAKKQGVAEEVEQINEEEPKSYPGEKGHMWHPTGKTAKHMESGKKTYEYAEVDNEGKRTGARHYKDIQGKHMGEEVEPPFKADKPKQRVVPGKEGKGYSTARHLARMAMQKQVDKLKKPVKESLEESRKAQIVKDIVKKKKSMTDDTFQKDPELSSTLTKTQ